MEDNLQNGLFNLDEFIDYPIAVVDNYFENKGWVSVQCFNDYKYAWVKADINKSIIAFVSMTDDESLGFEIVNSISWFDGIYTDGIDIKNTNITAQDIKDEMEKFLRKFKNRE
jgi:hypothetical protein